MRRKEEIISYFFPKYQIFKLSLVFNRIFSDQNLPKKSGYLGAGRERVEVREGSEREPRGPEVHRDRRACRPPGSFQPQYLSRALNRDLDFAVYPSRESYGSCQCFTSVKSYLKLSSYIFLLL